MTESILTIVGKPNADRTARLASSTHRREPFGYWIDLNLTEALFFVVERDGERRGDRAALRLSSLLTVWKLGESSRSPSVPDMKCRK